VSATAPVRPEDRGAIACPRCGAVVAGDQDWCLQCGAAARTRLVPTPNWRVPVALVAALAAVAGLALAIAFVALTRHNGAAGTTSTTQAPTVTAAPPATTPPPTAGAPSTAPPAATTPAPTSAAPATTPAPTTTAPAPATTPPGG
jgi:hypothetical protein